MKKPLFMAHYAGTTPANFPARDNIADCKVDAQEHARNNPRKRGYYSIYRGWEHLGLFATDCAHTIKGTKHGINIEWTE